MLRESADCVAPPGTEDEVHFLFQCPRLRQSRISIIDQIALKYKNFLNLDTKAHFIWLMSAEDTYKKMNELSVRDATDFRYFQK